MSTNIQNFFDNRHRFTDEQISALTKEEKAQLLTLLKEGKRSKDTKKMYKMLIKLSPESVKEDLRKILIDEKEDRFLRVVAAYNLSTVPDEKTEDYFLQVLSSDKAADIVTLKVIKGLGIFGTERSLGILKKFESKQMFAGMSQLSQLLISSRLKLPFDKHIEFNVEPPAASVKLLKIRPEKGKQISIDKHFLYGIKTGEDPYHYVCGKNRFAVLLNKELDSANLISSAPLIGAFIATKSIFDDTYFTNLILFICPKNGTSSEILVYRTDGLLSYGGTIQKDGSFELGTVKRFSNDNVYIKGMVSKKEIKFTEFLSGMRLVGKKKPMAFQPGKK